jgi:hypothetical protein
MLKLAQSREPFWLDLLPGVRVQFRPVTVAAILVARSAAADVLRAGGEDAEIKAGLAFTRALAQSGIAAAGRSLARDRADHRARLRPRRLNQAKTTARM